jgi:N4-gp56 family major capsid protein
MATLSFGVNDPQTVKRWSKFVEREALPSTLVGKFMGKGADFIVREMDELSKAAGDRVRYHLLALLTGDGMQSSGVGEGNEESPLYVEDDLFIEELRHQVRFKRRLTSQRVEFDLRNDARFLLGQWHADNLDRSFINQVTGNTVETDTKKTGNNTVAGVDADHQIWPGAITADESLTSSDTFTLDLFDKALTRAKMMRDRGLPILRPGRVPAVKGARWAAILSPEQIRDMRTDTSTGQWLDIQKSVVEGGDKEKNYIFKGGEFHGIYRGIAIFEDERIPNGVDSGTPTLAVASTRRAVLLGASSACVAFGRDGGRANRYTWAEETFDYEHEHGIDASLIYGLKKAQYDFDQDSTAEDYGNIVISTYAAAA